MAYAGVVKGSSIELQERTPYADGERVSVEIQPIEKGSRAAIQALLAALAQLAPVTKADTDALERAIEDGKLPPSKAIDFRDEN